MVALNIPHWNQLHDPDANGVEDAFATQDCGEECCSEVLYACSGQYTTEGQVRQAMSGHASTGITSAQDLANYLSSHGCPAEAVYPNAAGMMNMVKSQIEKRSPMIVLGYDVAPTYLHWVVAVDFGGGQAWFNDTWGGLQRSMPWGLFCRNYGGQGVQVNKPVRE